MTKKKVVVGIIIFVLLINGVSFIVFHDVYHESVHRYIHVITNGQLHDYIHYIEIAEEEEIREEAEINRFSEMTCKELKTYVFKFVVGKDVDQIPFDMWVAGDCKADPYD